jgi:ribonuclease Y
MTKSDEIKILLKDLRKQRESLEKRENKIKKLEDELIEKLESVAKLSKDKAEKLLLEELDKKLKEQKAKKIRANEDRIKLEAQEKARDILVDAMKHGATSYTAEYTVSSIKVPSEEVKGRIIGKEGRNIRSFEKEAGVEIELDETNEIKLSSFDSIRREIAKRSLLELIKDARIQPSRIEEVVKRNKTKMDDVLMEEGKKVTEECGVYNLPAEIIKYIGAFRYRTSYGQNLATHTIEETKIGIAIAKQVGADSEVVKLGCLLHDIGKVVDSKEETHVQAGVTVLKRHGFPKKVVACVAEHHEDKPFSSVESVIVWIADAISGSRPGARYEPHEDYVERMDKIEEVVKGFDGVEEAFAFQAGRDVRVVVNPEDVDDDAVVVLAHNIAQKLEKEAEYAGQIKVTVIREVRATDTTAAR